ncbi:MAG: hypothetical protein ABIN61_01025 [candidate division WOR-3 bacterium]
MGRRISDKVVGAIMLLLPLTLFGKVGLLISNLYTNNLYFISEIEKGGNKTEISPFFSYSGFFDLDYLGTFSMIEFNLDDIFFGNKISIQKKISLPELGNKNFVYIEGYNFTPLTYEQYRLNKLSIGDSILVNFGRYLLFVGTEVKLMNFNSDSIKDYVKGGLNSYVSIPMPFFYLVSRGGMGLMLYENEKLPYRMFSLEMDFPLTEDFNFSLSAFYSVLSDPKEYLIIDSLLLDPFFESEGVKKNTNLTFLIKKSFIKGKFYLDLSLDLFRRDFFEIGEIRRKDSGWLFDFQCRRMLRDKFWLFFVLSSIDNNSTIETLNYTENSFGVGIQLIF